MDQLLPLYTEVRGDLWIRNGIVLTFKQKTKQIKYYNKSWVKVIR